jgi:hypothetical protein
MTAGAGRLDAFSKAAISEPADANDLPAFAPHPKGETKQEKPNDINLLVP